ncbi:DUF1990 domain-containing protein [Deinococcus deserti]|uniref:DUF1990 domain-containing protein n=1 Tax=Deinococcus deserti (strain DSM 17065 / CIP 109153 / LMG 22923 / VCD115) TaxID=546414 RepID=C1D1T0_DEIDV|nr:DUF1990 family protein [Deinococcus deserti]ACO45804.1 hypothetical protein Deide_09270 [Deinococcus deserti VCD115]
MRKSVQREDDGRGALLERRYWVEVEHPQMSIQDLMLDIQQNLPQYAPELLAGFEKSVGMSDALRRGDEYHIRILGPWNGEVRVVEVSDTSFELVTLEDHPEAGRIRFSISPHEHFEDAFHFEICSLARSRDGLVALSYDALGKRVQQTVWTTFCERVAQRSGGRKIGDVQVRTVSETDFQAEDDSGDAP